MIAEIIEETPDRLPLYEQVPISFRVESYFRVQLIDKGLGGIRLVEEAVAPYNKDYDQKDDDRPSRWPERWDISAWGIIAAFTGDLRIGGAAVAWQTPEINLLPGRGDLAYLWDLRVHPEYRNQGVGHQLFTRSVQWAREHGCQGLAVETQNINVAACRFYARQGCELGAINSYAYDQSLNEVQLIWHLCL